MPQLDQMDTFASQIFWLVVTFTFLYLIVWRTALPRISDVIQERQRRIEEDLLKAEDLKRDGANALPKLHGALLKNEQDLSLFERLVYMNRHNC